MYICIERDIYICIYIYIYMSLYDPADLYTLERKIHE